MRRIKRPARRESWDAYRQRMLDETSRFIEWGLKHPELITPIPFKPVGEGGFPKQVADWFWATVLTTRQDSRIQRWRDILIRRPKELLSRRWR